MSDGGKAQLYEANEQRPNPGSNEPKEDSSIGKTNAHSAHDLQDSHSLANRAKHAEAVEAQKDAEAASKTITDPLAPARSHGNEPSRGAKIDAQIQNEEEEELRRKGKI